MKINLARSAGFYFLLVFGLLIMWSGFSGRSGLALAAIFTPEYLSVEGKQS